jgi:transcriptional regulator
MGSRVANPRNPDAFRGTLELLILKALSRRPEHGYGVARWIEQATSDLLRIEEGSLYPALRRLERRGWVESEWALSENNRQARYYRLTRRGRSELASERSRWSRFAGAVLRALRAT